MVKSAGQPFLDSCLELVTLSSCRECACLVDMSGKPPYLCVSDGILLCYVLLLAVEETRIYRAGGWVEFNRVNGERYKTPYTVQ